MKIDELLLETVHRGRVLIVRTFCEPSRMLSVQNAIEDETGNVERLAIYNGDPYLAPTQVLPKDAIVAVKEPYYKVTGDGSVTIRVDHPSDILLLDATHAMVPASLLPRLVELDKDALAYKNEGNTAYGKNDYLAAVGLYTKGIELCAADSGDEDLRRDLLRNRSLVNTLLGRFETARTDAITSLSPEVNGLVSSFDALQLGPSVDLNPEIWSKGKSNHVVKNDIKGLYRAGRAAYELGDYVGAERHFEDALLLDEDSDCVRELVRTTARITEQETGIYHFATPTRHRPRLDHAEFLANVYVKHTGDAKKGRGLFAKKAIKAGKLLLVEKAFCTAFHSDANREQYIIMDSNTDRISMGSDANLLLAIVQKMLYNPEIGAELMELYAGKATPYPNANNPLPVVDGVAAVETFHVQSVIEHNAFGIAGLRSSDEFISPTVTPDSEHERSSAGIRITASYINHACVANANRAFIGDLMIVRAAKDIAKDEELTIQYRVPEADVSQLQSILESGWGFKCTCLLCSAWETMTDKQRKRLRDAVHEATRFVASSILTMRTPANATTVDRAEELYSELEPLTMRQSTEIGFLAWALLASVFGCLKRTISRQHSKSKSYLSPLLRGCHLDAVLTDPGYVRQRSLCFAIWAMSSEEIV